MQLDSVMQPNKKADRLRSAKGRSKRSGWRGRIYQLTDSDTATNTATELTATNTACNCQPTLTSTPANVTFVSFHKLSRDQPKKSSIIFCRIIPRPTNQKRALLFPDGGGRKSRHQFHKERSFLRVRLNKREDSSVFRWAPCFEAKGFARRREEARGAGSSAGHRIRSAKRSSGSVFSK
jgi:hypothetical protein